MKVARSVTGGSAPRLGFVGAWVVFALVLAVGLLFWADARSVLAQSAQNAGYRDFSYAAPDGAFTPVGPTGEKPQSKLWLNDGIWWGSLFDGSPEAGEDPNGEYSIHRFDWGAQAWRDTNVPLDVRNSSKADTLWDGQRLYVATAVPPASGGGDVTAYVLRYSYDAANKTYSRDAGFPVGVGGGGIEAIVLDKDTTGKFWVTYTKGAQVYVNRSVRGDGVWGAPIALRPEGLPVESTSVGPDDISAVIRYDGKIGVMWSRQPDDTFYFATHNDGAPDDSWQGGIAARCDACADDHISLASLEADSAGRVFAAVKTSRHLGTSPNPDDPLVWLLVLGADGNWKPPAVFGRVQDDHTRAIVKIDQTNRKLYVFATAPCCSGGTLYYKRADLTDNISFPEGPGTPFIRSTTDYSVDDATSTKQNLNASTGLLVLASDDTTDYYLHNVIEFDSPAVALTAPSDGARVRGNVPLSADASDNTAVARVEFLVNGAVVATDTSAPYDATWNSAGVANGPATVSARAFDTSGNARTSESRTVTVDNSPADNTAPTVTAISPRSGATGVSATANVTATFSETMNPASLTGATVTLVRAGTTTPVSATVRCDSPCRKATLDPSASLARKTNYTATVKGGAGGAKDAAGNPLAANRVWSFKTARRRRITPAPAR